MRVGAGTKPGVYHLGTPMYVSLQRIVPQRYVGLSEIADGRTTLVHQRLTRNVFPGIVPLWYGFVRKDYNERPAGATTGELPGY
jgi:hypothetical protein